MRRETKDPLEKIIDVFCENNDTSKINVIMVDKDLTEISVLESKIPDAHIQICSFHVLKYVKTKVSKLHLKQDQKLELIQLLHQILYSIIKKCILKDGIGLVINLTAFQSISTITGIAVEKSGLGATRKMLRTMETLRTTKLNLITKR